MMPVPSLGVGPKVGGGGDENHEIVCGRGEGVAVEAVEVAWCEHWICCLWCKRVGGWDMHAARMHGDIDPPAPPVKCAAHHKPV
jgi:hypothetical protein